MLGFLSRAFVPIAAVLALAACGGGGGGGSTNSLGGGSPDFTVRPDRTSIAFEFRQGDAPQSQRVNATWTGTPPSAVYILATVDGTGLSQNIPIQITPTNASVTFTPLASLAVGQYSGVVHIAVCSDAACAQRIGGTPISISYTINVTPPTFTGPTQIQLKHVRFSADQPATATLNVTAAAGSWTASSSNTKVSVSPASGSGAGVVTVSVRPAEIRAAGHVSARITVTGSGTGAKTIDVSLSVVEPTFTVSPVSVSAVSGSTMLVPPITVQANLPGTSVTVPVMITTSSTSWIRIDSAPSSVSTDSPGVVALHVDEASGALASGSHLGSVWLRLGTWDDYTEIAANVNLSLSKATLSATPSSLEFGGALGRTFTDESIDISLNTDSRSHPWRVVSAPSWLDFDATSGSVSSMQQRIVMTPRRLQSSVGTATGTVVLAAQISGETITANLPVTFNLDQHRLIASEDGIAFVDVPSASWDRLSHTVTIADSFGLETAWTASSDRTWLQVTPSGTAGDDLVLTVNSAALPAIDQFTEATHTATVTISPPMGSTAEPARIRAGLWVGSTTPSAQVQHGPLNNYPRHVVGDPIRPYAYVYEHDTTLVRVFNIYTGAELAPITGLAPLVPPTQRKELFVTSDGDRMYTYESGFAICRFIPMDLTTGTVGAPFADCDGSMSTVGRGLFTYARPNGVGVILSMNGEVLSPSTGAVIAGHGVFGRFAVSGDNKRVFGTATSSIDFTSARGGVFVRTDDGEIPDISDKWKATDFDGGRVYVVDSGTLPNPANRLRRANGLTNAELSDVSSGLAYERVAVSRTGNIFFTASNDFYALRPDLSPLLTPISIGNEQGLLSSSGDGRFALVLSGSPDMQVHIIPVGP